MLVRPTAVPARVSAQPSSSLRRHTAARIPCCCLLPVESNWIIPSSTSHFSSKISGSKFWLCGNIKYQKADRRHRQGKKARNLEVLRKYELSDHLKFSASSENQGIADDMQLLKGSVEETIPSSSQEIVNSLFTNQQVSEKDIELSTKPSSSSPEKQSLVHNNQNTKAPSLCIAVVGATGELARNKVFPALFALYYSGFLPENVGIFGYSRKELTDEDLRCIITETLTCRVDHHENCGAKLEDFLSRTYHINGGFDNQVGMKKLNSQMEQIEDDHEANRIFYLSVPQEALLDVSISIADNAQTKRGWNRIIVEKPFGFNAVASCQLTQYLLSKFQENQIYRIDHLLGKNLIENITVLRFSNLVFEPLWCRTYIRNVQVVLSEEYGMETRGRIPYFDVVDYSLFCIYFGGYGIIRDIVHSHILQTIALFAMEPPVSLNGEDIRNEKVKVLRSIRKLDLDDVVLGQYKHSTVEEDPYMNSLTPTFFAAALYIDNARWDGVPFLIKTGIGLIKHRVEIRIQFHHVPGNLYRERIGHNIDLATNELILRDQPDEAILLKVNNKVPGLGLQLDASELNLLYRDKYNVEMPDSYEHLLLDVIDGDTHLFMRSDELEAAWDILNPILHEIDEKRLAPELYEVGGRGPVAAYYLGAKHGVRWADD